MLGSLGYACVRRQQADPGEVVPDILIFRAEGLPQVDVLLAKTAFEHEVLKRAVQVAVGGETVPVASLEDLVVYKLIANRRRDRDDIRAVLSTQARAGRPVDWDYIESWAKQWGIADRAAKARAELALDER